MEKFANTNAYADKAATLARSLFGFGVKSAWMGLVVVYTGVFLANGASAVPVQDMALLWGVVAGGAVLS